MEQRMKAVHISRPDLYEQVWTEPMTKVAERLGISDVGLAKACVRADIPTPPRGHWAKLQAGKPSRRPPLPAIHDWQPEVVTLVPPPSKPKRSKSPPAIEFEDIASAVEQETRGKKIQPDLALKDPHQVIRRAMREHQEYQSWATGGSQQARERAASEPLTKRRWAILSGLFKALEQRHIKVGEPETRNDSTCYPLEVAGEKVHLRFRERVRQARRELTKDERSRSWNRDRTWAQERFPTGELTFSLSRYNPSPWEEWSDQPDLPLEVQLSEVVIGIYRAAAVERTHRLEREASAKRYREEQHRQWLQDEARKQQAKRAATLIQHAHDWQSATAVRSLIDAVQAAGRNGHLPCGAEELTGWASWAATVADQLDPVASGKVLDTLKTKDIEETHSPHRWG
jgi:hypothetical protein